MLQSVGFTGVARSRTRGTAKSQMGPISAFWGGVQNLLRGVEEMKRPRRRRQAAASGPATSRTPSAPSARISGARASGPHALRESFLTAPTTGAAAAPRRRTITNASKTIAARPVRRGPCLLASLGLVVLDSLRHSNTRINELSGTRRFFCACARPAPSNAGHRQA